jgi:Domain of unknown function (DUF3883)
VKTASQRERLMLAGLFLSKFSKDGLRHLGFETFSEAYNAIGYALGGKPASIKNYMQEFDPMFPNGRKGWHARDMRAHCREAFEQFGSLSLTEFTRLLKPLLFSEDESLPEELVELEVFQEEQLENESFSKRLITGLAAEGFFEASFHRIAEFVDHSLSNVTRFGCGFDFRVQPGAAHPFLAVEVKGIAGMGGDVTMTSKEHRVAEYLGDRYYLCLVRNFIEKPVLSLYQNPLKQGFNFTPRERSQTTITWHARFSI